MNYFDHHIGDYRKDTGHLSLLEHGIYRQLLDTYYMDEKPLTVDIARLMRSHCVRNAEEQRALENVLQDFFIRTEDGYRHKRCDVVIEAYHEKSSKAGESAKARWDRVRAEKAKQCLDDANAMRTHSEGNANHKPVTSNQEPRTNNQNPETRTKDSKALPKQNQEQPLASTMSTPASTPPKKQSDAKDAPNSLNLETWKSYKQAYASRYGVDPIRDAPTNAKIKAIVAGLGDEAPAVAEFFVSHNGSRYVAGMHQIGMLSMDYAKLRTEWATNSRMTSTKAMQADKTQTNYDAFAPLIAEAEARERLNG